MKKTILILLTAAVIFGGFLFFRNDIEDFYKKISLQLPEVKEGINNVTQEIKKQVLTPPPLTATEESEQSFLTKQGVIEWTNTQRKNNGLPPLKENLNLDLSAEIKVEDMFKNQYFAHESPSGKGVVDLAAAVGYDYIMIGENLALGNFENDEILVQSWMDSPGHRENILNKNYQEIGVAVVKGTYGGRTTWLAVQHFGFPISACFQPSEELKIQIEDNQNYAVVLQAELAALKNEIENMKPRHNPDYNKKIEEYNNLISEYNNLITETKNLVSIYNSQVNTFNNCAKIE